MVGDLWCSWPKVVDTRRKKRPPLMTRDGAAECNLSQTGLYIIFSLKQLTCAHFFSLCNSSSAKGKTWQVSIWRAAAGSLHQSSPHLLLKRIFCLGEFETNQFQCRCIDAVLNISAIYGDSETGHSTSSASQKYLRSIFKQTCELVKWHLSSDIFYRNRQTEIKETLPENQSNTELWAQKTKEANTID